MRIYIAAWPRSGTKHLGRMIASALGEVHGVGTLRSRGGRQDDSIMPAVMQCHFSANHGRAGYDRLFVDSAVVYRNLREDEHLIWNVRDPRDTAISLWQMGMRGKWLELCTLAEYLESHFCAEVLNAPDFGPSMSWGTYTKGWLKACDVDARIIRKKHEATMKNREHFLEHVLLMMGHSVSERDIKRAVAPELGRLRLSYDGKDDYTPAGRSIWQKYFNHRSAKILHDHCGYTMAALHYGWEPEWLALVGKDK
jgi:hypothetical protein